ncbi:MAG: formyltetrahydrofolate deformylase [Woeseia sp.]
MNPADEYILKLSCEDQPGIVAAVSRVIAENNGNITECQQFEDHETGRFLMRVVFRSKDIERTRFHLAPVIERFALDHELVPRKQRGRVLIMASNSDHCLHDLLYRWKKGNLNMDIVGIVSNHDVARPMAESYGIEYDLLPVTKENKARQEQALKGIIDERQVELIILARYMQILSDQIANGLYGRVINIHHSFLPSFKGARPYHQAHHRGVKLIGATAHYVTPDLDEGPIIEQEVARVKHSDTADDLVRIGRDVESRVLARAVTWHLDHRVFLNDAKTVVFN